MISVFSKRQLDECFAEITRVCHEIARLDEIELVQTGFPANRPLRRTEARVVRLYARRLDGAVVRVSPLGGGLSNARTCRVRVEDAHGQVRAHTVAKLGQLAELGREETRYAGHIANLLNVNAFTALARKVDVGAGDVGGLFYTLADGYDAALLDVVRADPARAAEVVGRLGPILSPWTGGASHEQTTVGAIRRSLVRDETMEQTCAPFLDHLDWRRFEQRAVNVRRCAKHGDLHGLNVLVSPDGHPVLIDYGDVGMGTASLDLVVLELSLLFHPNNILETGGWPSAADAAAWTDLDRFAAGTRFGPYIRACRTHAVSVARGPREIWANAYAYAVRQLKYKDTDKALAVAIAHSAMSAFAADD